MASSEKNKNAISSLGRFAGWSMIYGRAGEHDSPYMLRLWVGRLRLHVFFRGDLDPDCHDHPWDFWTFPLTPYVEEVAIARRETVAEGVEPLPQRFDLIRQVVRAFEWTYRPATHCHRVIGALDPKSLFRKSATEFAYIRDDLRIIEGKKIVTLIWRGKQGRSWGFLKKRDGRWCWTPWKEYVFGGGKDAPCSEPNPEPGSYADLESRADKLGLRFFSKPTQDQLLDAVTRQDRMEGGGE